MIDEAKEQEPVGEQKADAPEDLGDVETITEEGEVPETETVTEAEILRRELDETRDQLLRVAAEFDNVKKRMERERSKLLKYAGENILRELLATLDNLDRAVAQGSTAADDDTQKLDSMLQGLELTRKGLVSTLERFGVEDDEVVRHDLSELGPRPRVLDEHLVEALNLRPGAADEVEAFERDLPLRALAEGFHEVFRLEGP